jgi:TolB protein
MSDEQSPSSYAPFIALAVVLALFVLALIGVLVTALIVYVFAQAAPSAAPENAASLNRLAVVADGKIYTIDPDGSNRLDLAHSGRVPTAAVIWSHDGQRLIFVENERARTRVTSARPDGQDARVLHEAGQDYEPFYLYGSPDDRHVAFLAPDPLEGMQLHIAETDRLDSVRSAVTGQPNYSSWSPDSQSLLVHIGGTSVEAYVGTYDLSAAATQPIETQPAAFQAPFWSPTGEARWLYARQTESNSQLVISDARNRRTLAEFDGGIAFGWSPDGQHVAYAINTPDSFLYERLTVIDLADSSSQVYFKGNLLSFFWSPDGKQLAYLTGVLVEPSPVGRAGGLAASAVASLRAHPERSEAKSKGAKQSHQPAEIATSRTALLVMTQQRTLQMTWHVIDLEHDRTIDLNTFEPTGDFLYLVQYFDQFAQSVAVWSPDSRSLVYTGQPLIGERGVYIVGAQDVAAAPRFVGPGDFAAWSWH